MRYVWRGGSRDRTVVLQSRKNVVFDDAVRTFFDAPEQKGGALWIDFPADRRPLVRVSTYPDSRRYASSVSAPLLETESTNSLLNELTIAGVKEGEQARFDLGVISVGPAPAAFRIAATDARGRPVGISKEAHAEERDIYLLTDVRRALELPPLDPVTIHVRVLSGTAIAYGAIVSYVDFSQQVIPAAPTYAR